MRRQPLLAKAALRLQIATTINQPPPVGGINSRDAYTAMKKEDAVFMKNFYPRGNYVEIRAGNSNHATGMTGNGKTLATYSALTGTETMFCSTPSGIYNVTSSGAVGASVLARTEGKHQWIMFGDGTNNWLIMCNGVDNPAFYNGTTWTSVDGASTPAITGVATQILIAPMVYQGRLYFAAVNTLNMWYLPPGVVGGAATKFDLSLVASRGGYIVAMINWTYDGGSGSDDRAVFITSQGEVIVYEGDDPGTAANWRKVGTYYIGKPIGRKCVCKYGGDVLVMTEDGIVALSGALTGVVNDSKFKITDKIRNYYIEQVKNYGSVAGWEMMIYPKESALVVNIPKVADSSSDQLVMNLVTGAWTRFTDWDAMGFGILNSQLYYTIGTKTVKAWSGVSDAANSVTTQIAATFSTAYSNFGTPAFKRPKSMRVVASGNTATYTPVTAVSTSFNSVGSVDGSNSHEVAANSVSNNFFSVTSYGGEWISSYYSVSTSTNGGLLRVHNLEHLYEIGGVSL